MCNLYVESDERRLVDVAAMRFASAPRVARRAAPRPPQRPARERPCSRRCEPLSRFCGAQAQHGLLVRVSILFHVSIPNCSRFRPGSDGGNCPRDRRNIGNARPNVRPGVYSCGRAMPGRFSTRRDDHGPAPSNVARSPRSVAPFADQRAENTPRARRRRARDDAAYVADATGAR